MGVSVIGSKGPAGISTPQAESHSAQRSRTDGNERQVGTKERRRRRNEIRLRVVDCTRPAPVRGSKQLT